MVLCIITVEYAYFLNLDIYRKVYMLIVIVLKLPMCECVYIDCYYIVLWLWYWKRSVIVTIPTALGFTLDNMCGQPPFLTAQTRYMTLNIDQNYYKIHHYVIWTCHLLIYFNCHLMNCLSLPLGNKYEFTTVLSLPLDCRD